MRAFAEYVMHGRRQAIIVVLLCGFFPMLYFASAAVVGLVNLRKGWQEGLIVLLWAMLPAVFLWQVTGDTMPVVLMPGIMLLALVLRSSGSWRQAILVATGLGLAVQLSLAFQPGFLAEWESFANQVIEAQLRQGAEVQYSANQLVELLLMIYGASHAVTMLVCLVLARWWQALLYNPGGFRQEFHQLRFDPRVMLAVLGLLLLGLAGVEPFDDWMAVLSIPAMFGGLAAMHGIVAARKLGTHWLVLGYLTLLLMYPAVVALGVMDSVFDLRKRISK